MLIMAVSEHKGAVMFGVDKTGWGYTINAWISGEKVMSRHYRPEADAIEVMHAEIEEFISDISVVP